MAEVAGPGDQTACYCVVKTLFEGDNGKINFRHLCNYIDRRFSVIEAHLDHLRLKRCDRTAFRAFEVDVNYTST